MPFVQVTGGSSGIGKSVAVQAAEKGANVTIIARDSGKLRDAKEEITSACISADQKIVSISCEFMLRRFSRLQVE